MTKSGWQCIHAPFRIEIHKRWLIWLSWHDTAVSLCTNMSGVDHMCWEVYRYVCMRLDTNIDRPFERAYTSQVVETAPSTAAHSRDSRLRYKLYMFSCVRAPPLFESFFENKSFADFGQSPSVGTIVIHSHVWHDLSTRVTWLIHTCDMTHLHVWHDSFTRVIWLILMCDTTYLHVWHDSCHTCVMGHSHVWNDSFIKAT